MSVFLFVMLVMSTCWCCSVHSRPHRDRIAVPRRPSVSRAYHGGHEVSSAAGEEAKPAVRANTATQVHRRCAVCRRRHGR